MALLCQDKAFGNLFPFGKPRQNGSLGKKKGMMPIKFGSGVACWLSHPAGAGVLRSSTIPEFKLLVLVGGGLIVLATLVRRLYPNGGAAAPKSMEMRVWISPPEMVEKMARRESV